jgi:tRNA(Ile)-lysidine synthase TilS/MesJ
MQANLPQAHFSRLMRAVVEFNMIEDGDKILIGLSGGKDSIFMTYALAALRKHLKKDFSLAAMTIDPMFSDDFSLDRLTEFCDSLDIPFYTQKVDIAGAIAAQNGKDPCYTCSFFRRGAMNRFALENGFNKVAYAHHNDDAVETFFMSLLCSGQIKTFLPVTYLDRTGLTVIRPLIYFREAELIAATALHGFVPLKSPCPIDGKTKRQDIKELIQELGKSIPECYEHLAAAMRTSPRTELWPSAKNRRAMKSLYDRFMYGEKD